jgi:hypothetical protein
MTLRGDDPNEDGVVGTTGGPDKRGVFGFAPQGTGVRGVTQSNANFGIFGSNDSPNAPTGGGAGGAGVFGLSGSPGAAGVFGANNSAHGVGVQGNGTDMGVSGFSPQRTGVRGITQSSANFGIFGSNDSSNPPTGGGAGGAGVFGLSVSPGGAGVFGANNSANGVGVQGDGPSAGVRGFSANGVGVVGQGVQNSGVNGFRGNPNLGGVIASEAGKAGVFGASDFGAGVMGFSTNTQSFGVIAFGGIRASAIDHPLAGEFNGKVQVNGDVQVSGDIFLPGAADCAEQFDVAEPIEPGTVVVIDQQGALRQSRIAYDKKVAGVVSGAGTYRPGIILDKQHGPSDRLPVALVGKVYCKVDAQYSPIEVGDVLTSSPTAGHAMKATDPIRAFGAVIGKALRAWDEGSGLIPILVSLQ